MSLERLSEVFREFLKIGSRDLWNVLERGLSRAILRRDPTMIYHYMSMLSEDYYGMELDYIAGDYYKVYKDAEKIRLPKPLEKSSKDLFDIIRSRRSRRSFSREPISLEELSSVLYYSVGISGRAWWGGPKRVYPSAGALQPVEAYVVTSQVNNLDPGLYHYNPGEHSLELLRLGDFAETLARIALDQMFISDAAASIVLTIVYRRTASKYGLRSYKYSHLDTGFVGQNIYLVVEALNLATVAVGAFYDKRLCEFLEIDCEEEMPALIFPIGRKSRG
ncbi:MAG: SagB/ThcOx family dehydrogenase [Sulfolobales archaeon]